MNPALDDEDAKIVTLARTARARSGAEQGAAARDDTGRTYAAATLVAGAYGVSALAGAVSAAASSGATGYEAFAVVAEQPALADDDRGLLAALAPGVPVLLATPDGAVVETVLETVET